MAQAIRSGRCARSGTLSSGSPLLWRTVGRGFLRPCRGAFTRYTSKGYCLACTACGCTPSVRRNYDLYIGKRQFAAISGNFLAWEFELKDEKGGTLALIDRNFQVWA